MSAYHFKYFILCNSIKTFKTSNEHHVLKLISQKQQVLDIMSQNRKALFSKQMLLIKASVNGFVLGTFPPNTFNTCLLFCHYVHTLYTHIYLYVVLYTHTYTLVPWVRELKLWKYDFRMEREFTGNLFQPPDFTDGEKDVKEI